MFLGFSRRQMVASVVCFAQYVLTVFALRFLTTEQIALREDWGYVAFFGLVFALVQALFDFNKKSFLFFWTIALLYFLSAFVKRFDGMILSEREIVHTLCFASFIGCFLLLLQYALSGFKVFGRFKAFFALFLACVGVFPAFVMIGYFLVNHAVFSAEILLTLFQTNKEEVLAYLVDQNLWLWGFLSLVILSCILYMGCFFCKIRPRDGFKKMLFAATTIALLWAGFKILPKTNVHFVFNIAVNTFETLQNFEKYAQSKDVRLKRVKALLKEGVSAHYDGVYILVIGESETRDHMSAYGYERQTTPWLESVKNSQDVAFFSNAYSNHTHTVPVLSFALSTMDQYHDVDFSNAYSIIEVARAAGFETYWISNQPKESVLTNPVSIMAGAADKQIWLNNSVGDKLSTAYYDEKLADTLQNLELPNKAFVVLHLMGCHGAYRDRYPKAFERFANGPSKRVDTYDNSVLYTDYVLQKIDEVAVKNPHFMALVYLSDHGEDQDKSLGHESSRFTYKMARIPFFVKVSNTFKASRPRFFEALKKNSNAVFTNDLLDNLLADLLGVEGLAEYQAYFNLASTRYGLSKEEALTLHGQKHLKDE